MGYGVRNPGATPIADDAHRSMWGARVGSARVPCRVSRLPYPVLRVRHFNTVGYARQLSAERFGRLRYTLAARCVAAFGNSREV